MPLPNETRPEDRIRRIQEETEHLGRQVNQAAEAAHRALAADSMASGSEKYSTERDSEGPNEAGPGSGGEPEKPKRSWKRSWKRMRKGRGRHDGRRDGRRG